MWMISNFSAYQLNSWHKKSLRTPLEITRIIFKIFFSRNILCKTGNQSLIHSPRYNPFTNLHHITTCRPGHCSAYFHPFLLHWTNGTATLTPYQPTSQAAITALQPWQPLSHQPANLSSNHQTNQRENQVISCLVAFQSTKPLPTSRPGNHFGKSTFTCPVSSGQFRETIQLIYPPNDQQIQVLHLSTSFIIYEVDQTKGLMKSTIKMSTTFKFVSLDQRHICFINPLWQFLP